MKNEKTKFNKSKLFARVMLIILLTASAVSLASCGKIPYDWEVETHKDFEKQIETYFSTHDLHVDTFISFDLDNHENITKSIYFTGSMVTARAMRFMEKHEYTCDLYSDGLAQILVFYLKSDGENTNDYAYKIKCSFTRVDFNYTKEDKIEIIDSECTYYSLKSTLRNDFFYEETLEGDDANVETYNHVYHYALCINDVEACCVHISSIEEASDEKLKEIHQMLLDSLVVMNAQDFFIWREMK